MTRLSVTPMASGWVHHTGLESRPVRSVRPLAVAGLGPDASGHGLSAGLNSLYDTTI
jgi:hypothetical protein